MKKLLGIVVLGLLLMRGNFYFSIKKNFKQQKAFYNSFYNFLFWMNQKTALPGDVASFPGYRIPVKIINKVLFNYY